MRYTLQVWTSVWGDTPIPDSVLGCKRFVDADSTSAASDVARRRFPGATRIKISPLTVAGTPSPLGAEEVTECGTDCASCPIPRQVTDEEIDATVAQVFSCPLTTPRVPSEPVWGKHLPSQPLTESLRAMGFPA